MATSLARQLALLRTPASLAASTALDSAYSGPFLFPEADQDHCDLHSLKERMSESLNYMSDIQLVFARFQLFLTEDRLDDHNLSDLLEDLLLLLSPYSLLKPAQWILQYLVTKHKVHYKYPELFFFCVLPFYDYEIYTKAVAAINVAPGGTKYPNWYPRFKQACFPTTKLSLYRHTASDLGFFKLLCDLMLRLAKHATKYPEAARVQRQTAVFLTSVLGGLENCGGRLSEEKALHLLQVILAGLKNCSADYKATCQIMLAYILPKVNLKDKTTAKITKSLKKCANEMPSSTEVLMLAVLIVRTQLHADHFKLSDLMVTLEPALNVVMNTLDSDQADGQQKEFSNNVLHTIGLLVKTSCQQVDQGMAVSSHLPQLLQICQGFLKNTVLSSDVVFFIAQHAYRMLKMTLKKEAELEGDGINPYAELKPMLEKIITTVEKTYPDVYQKVCVNPEDVDLFFFSGSNVQAKPDDVMVAAKRALMDNQLVLFLTSELSSSNLIFKKKKIDKLLKGNQTAIQALLLVDSKFLLEQMKPSAIENLLVNLLRLTPDVDPDAVMAKLFCDEFSSLPFNMTRVELLMLPKFFSYTGTESVVKLIGGSIRGRSSAFLSTLCTITSNNPEKASAVIDKLRLMITPEYLSFAATDPAVSNSSEILATLFCAINLQLAEQGSGAAPEALISSIVDLIVACLKSANINDKFEDLDTESHLQMARISGKIPAKLITDAFGRLTLAEGNVTELTKILEILPQLYENSKTLLVQSVFSTILALCATTEKLFETILRCIHSNKNVKVRYACLHHLLQLPIDSQSAQKLLSADRHNTFVPLILAQVFHACPSVQKASLKLLKRVMEHTGKESEKTDGIKNIVQFLIENKSEIVSNVANIDKLLKASSLEEDKISLLLDQCIELPPTMFETAMPFFAKLSSGKYIEKVAAYGQDMLTRSAADMDDCMFSLVITFKKKLVNNLTADKVLSFFIQCLLSNTVITAAGLPKKVAVCLIESCSNAKYWQKVSEEVVSAILKEIVEHHDRVPSEIWPLLACFQVTPSMMADLFTKVWGEDVFTKKDRLHGRGNFSLRYGGDRPAVGPDGEESLESAQWLKTIFVLELLEKVLAKCNTSSSADKEEADWSPMVSKLFVLLRQISENEMEESSYKISLLLTVLHQVFVSLTEVKLKSLNSRDLDPELLTNIIRQCPNPDTRKLALQVLAKCSMASPEFVLQNSMSIFTFMGSHLLKVDSIHSYKVACEAIDVIVPAVKQACQVTTKSGEVPGTKLATTCQNMLSTFVDSSTDVPEHRYAEFMFRLVNALGADTYLWMAMLMAVKVDLKPTKGGRAGQHPTDMTHRRMVDLFCRFPAKVGLGAVLRILVNTRTDAVQLRRLFNLKQDRKEDGTPDEWDVLRLRGLVLSSHLLSSHLVKVHLGKAIGSDESEDDEDEDGEGQEVVQILNLLLESAILLVDTYESQLPPSVPSKLRKSLVSQSERILEDSLSLLPYNTFLKLVGNLLSSSNPNIRRRSLEVVSSKLTETVRESLAPTALADLLPPLVNLAVTEDHPNNQQMALLSVRQIAKQMMLDTEEQKSANRTGEQYSRLCTAVTKLSEEAFLSGLRNAGVLGASVLALADLLIAVELHAIPFVTKVVVWLREKLDSLESATDWTEKDLKVLYPSIIFSLQKIVETFGGFINPQLKSIVLLSCRLVSNERAALRAKGLINTLAENLQPHILLPQARSLTESLWDEPEAVGVFLQLLAANARKLERNKLTASSKQFVDLFSLALSYRVKHCSSDAKSEISNETMDQTETEIINSLLGIFLRLSLEDFKPAFLQFTNNLKVEANESIHGLTTMFHLVEKCGARLKGLFNFGLDLAVGEATSCLPVAWEAAKNGESGATGLVKKILACLTVILTYNKFTSKITNQQYEQLVASLLKLYQLPEEVYAALEDCLVQLAGATEDDANWKHLNFTVLMCLRDDNSAVRLAVLSLLTRYVSDRTDTYLVVLPDAVPFFSELLEDDDQEVESKCRELIQHMETTFGQSIESYFL